MKTTCDIIRDLLPLYIDNACSERSRELVDEHLAECPDCAALREKLRHTEVEEDLKEEKASVIAYAARRIRRRSTLVGALVSILCLVPLFVCLVVCIAFGYSMGIFFALLASYLVAASVIAVPILVPRDKLLWTLSAFTVSLMILLKVVSVYYPGYSDWYPVASSAMLFGLAVVCLPFVVRARPVREILGRANRLYVVLGADMILFVNMVNMIAAHHGFTFRTIILGLITLLSFGALGLYIVKKR